MIDAKRIAELREHFSCIRHQGIPGIIACPLCDDLLLILTRYEAALPLIEVIEDMPLDRLEYWAGVSDPDTNRGMLFRHIYAFRSGLDLRAKLKEGGGK